MSYIFEYKLLFFPVKICLNQTKHTSKKENKKSPPPICDIICIWLYCSLAIRNEQTSHLKEHGWSMRAEFFLLFQQFLDFRWKTIYSTVLYKYHKQCFILLCSVGMNA